MHEQVAPETVLNAFLDTCDLQAVGTALATCSLVSPNLHLIVVQQSSHAALVKVCASTTPTLPVTLVLHHRQRGPTDPAPNLPRANPSCRTSASRPARGSKAAFVIATTANISLTIMDCLSLMSTAPAKPKNVNLNCLQLPEVP